jgi:hypothetical protein
MGKIKAYNHGQKLTISDKSLQLYMDKKLKKRSKRKDKKEKKGMAMEEWPVFVTAFGGGDLL